MLFIFTAENRAFFAPTLATIRHALHRVLTANDSRERGHGRARNVRPRRS